MKQQTKYIILIAGSVILLGAIGFGIYLHFASKNKEEKENPSGEKDKEKSDGKQDPPPLNNPPPPPAYEPPSNTVAPKYNVEGELSNPYGEIKGKVLYPKRKEVGGWGYANIRSSVEVNTDQGWWDFSDNLLTTINSGIPIGTVTGEEAGLFNNYSYRWFKVKLIKPVGFWGNTYEGYVRADTVTFIPYEK